MTLNLGYIDFLNCYPFYYHLLEKEPDPDIRLFPDYPGKLNTKLARGDIDMSPISLAAYAGLWGDVLLLPEFCLSSVGYVGSVTLASKHPIEDLHRRTIGVTNASHTSVVLLQILLKRYYQAKPEYVTTGPCPDPEERDAALLIGNYAMLKSSRPSPYMYDLGDLWLRKTGYPVVFAVFAVRKKALQESGEQVRKVVEAYHRSLSCLEAEKETVVRKAGERYPHIVYDIHDYYDRFCFDFSENLQNAAMFYFEQANSLGLLPRVRHLEFMG